MEWNSPESEMVAYRSFSPFFHLILCYEAPQVQLWALWAILHVCSKNGITKRFFSPPNLMTFSVLIGKRYCLMLYEEEGDEILSAIVSNPNASKEVCQFCFSILELLRMEGLLRDDSHLKLSLDGPKSKQLKNELCS